MLQRKLYLEAKQSKTFKFYVLYDKISLDYFIQEAYIRVKANGCAPGVDQLSFDKIEEAGLAPFLSNIKEELINKTYKALKEGRTAVYDADLEAYFDTIPHDKLIKAVEQRIADKNVLALINQWLKCPIIDDETKKTLGGKNNQRGTPQGGVISPLLSKIYLNLLDRIIENPMSVFGKEGVKIVRYADDFLLFSKFPSFRAYTYLENILTRMGLYLNKEKTSTNNVRVEALDFLGFSVRNSRTPYKGALNLFWNIIPSKKAEQKIRRSIKDTLRTSLHLRPKVYVKRLNIQLRGWVNYFKIKGVSHMYDSISRVAGYLGETLYRMNRRKRQNGWSKRYR